MEIVKYLLIGIPALMAILSGIMKLTRNTKIVETMNQVGAGKILPALGIAEILFALLFIYPPTRNLGFVLLICYFSGAMATDLTHKRPFFAPVMLLSILFIAQYVNTPSFFF